MPESSRRQLYRVTYPLVERPTFEVGRFLHQVIDLSEKGMRYYVQDMRMPLLGAEIAGTVAFRRGDEISVQGEVIRTRAGMVVLELMPPMPFAEVLAEQRYLRSKGYLLKE